MSEFEKRFVSRMPLSYYIVLGTGAAGSDWLHVDPAITDEPVYAPEGVVALFTDDHRIREGRMGKPFEIICLSCFFQILRTVSGTRLATLDGTYLLMVMPWRTPCETTALYTDHKGTYYMEACGDYGVFWRCSGDRPRSEPPSVYCSAFEENGGCLGADCPFGSCDEEFAAAILATKH